jgi:hypothetical protein
MLYYGSPIQTTTNLELTKLLGLNLKPIKSFRNGKYHFLNLFRYYEKSGKEHNAEVSLANRIYVQEGLKHKDKTAAKQLVLLHFKNDVPKDAVASV